MAQGAGKIKNVGARCAVPVFDTTQNRRLMARLAVPLRVLNYIILSAPLSFPFLPNPVLLPQV